MGGPVTSAALDELDTAAEEIAAEVRADLQLEGPQPVAGGVRRETDLTSDEQNAAIVRGITLFFGHLETAFDSVSRSHGITPADEDELNRVWLENDYYAKPSSYPQIPVYFGNLHAYLENAYGLIKDEMWVSRVFTGAVVEAGMTPSSGTIDEFVSGYRESSASSDTTFALGMEFAGAALDFHKLLLEYEGEISVDPATQELVFAGRRAVQPLVTLEERVLQLGQLFFERQASRLGLIETMADSIRAAIGGG